MAHKTPQIKPSVASLYMPGNAMGDLCPSNDKEGGFALPLVGKRRRSSVHLLPKQV